MLKSDDKGFLIADSAIGVDELTHGIKGIKRDTAMLIRLLKGQAKSTVLQRARVENPNSGSMRVPASRGRGAAGNPAGGSARERDSRGRYVKGSTQPGGDVAKAVQQMTRQQAAIEKRTEAAKQNREGNAQSRDSRGRFGAGEGDDDNKGDKDGLFARLKSVFSDKGGTGDLDKVDPAIEAANEMKNMVGGAIGGLKSVGELGNAVIGRGFNGEGKDKAVPWYRRMLQQLKLMRKDESTFSKAEIKAVNGIKTGGGGDGDGFFMSLLKMIFSPIGVALIAAAVAAWATMGDKISDAWNGMIRYISDKWDAAIKPFSDVLDKVGALIHRLFPNMGAAPVPKPNGPSTLDNTDPAGLRTNKGLQIRRDMLQKQYDEVKNDPSKATYAKNIKRDLDAANAELKGGRAKQSFDGITGGGDLATYGTYTSAEADKVRQLKSSGENTSASVKGGMPKEIQQKIIDQAKAAGLDPSMMLKIASMESGGNANAISKTGAIGVYQFTGGTATGVGIKDRFDADQNIAGGMDLAKQNIAILKKSKLPVTPENVYMMHQLGPDAAKEVILGAASGKNISDLSADTQKAVSLNYGNGVKTAADYLGKNNAALTARADATIGKSATGFLPTGPAPLPALTANTAIPAPLSAPVAIPSVSVSAPSLPASAPRSDIPVPLNSKGPLEVTVKNDQLANQDVRDRRLAQIATGGIAGG